MRSRSRSLVGTVLVAVTGLALCCCGVGVASYGLRTQEGGVVATSAPQEAVEDPAEPAEDERMPEPEPVAEEETDPRFDTCAEAIEAGLGPYAAGVDPEYGWYDDRDDDGLVCERG